MGFVHPSLDPDGWNGLTIGFDRVPGFVELPQFTVDRKIDEKPSPGSESFALTDKGANCTDVTIVFVLVRPEDFGPFEKIYTDYLSPRRPLKKQNVVPVVHPVLYLAGIRQLYFFSASGFTASGGGFASYRITCKGKEFNEQSKIGGGGGKSKKVKAETSKIGTAGKWTDKNLGTVPGDTPGTTVVGDFSPQADKQKPTARTQTQLRKDAASGKPDAKFAAGVQDKAAAGDW